MEREPSSETKSEPSWPRRRPPAGPRQCRREREASEEILVFAGGMAVLHGQADDFVAAALGAVPGAVLGGEAVALELGGELRALVEEHLQRGEVRIHQDIRGDDLGLQFGMLAGVARVLHAAARAAM